MDGKKHNSMKNFNRPALNFTVESRIKIVRELANEKRLVRFIKSNVFSRSTSRFGAKCQSR
ncbi:hypothetical protein K1T71_008980, partial [Dendrolimus kikuchii]